MGAGARFRWPRNPLPCNKKPAKLSSVRVPRGCATVWRSVLACPEGLEPPTYSLEGYCSIQLSYGQMDVAGCVADRLAECPQLLGAGR